MPAILFSTEGQVAHVRLNRPQALNAIDEEMDCALLDAWNAINADPQIRVVSLSAQGERAFCVGGDLRNPRRSSRRLGFGGGITGVGGPLVTVTKPIVAAVQGYVLGGGFELAMCADIIVAADTAQFGLPETAAGVIADCGVVHRAIRQLPHRVALAMILAGQRLTADQALRFGLVNEMVAFATLESAAEGWCARILAASPLAVQAAKDAVISRLDHPLAVALSTRFEKIEAYGASMDHAEAKSAFTSKRAPRWEGR